MAPHSINWRCAYVLPEHRHSVLGHFVGPYITYPYLEFAVPSDMAQPINDITYDLTDDVIVQLPISSETMEPERARQDAFELFLTQAAKGIEEFGPDLAEYYRQRYPSHKLWIEYAVLINNLPVCITIR
ncbi:hypothetical protein IL306_001462 [Fusarium sp. DS 682]|nr:hypothetical protein IL306_001462 [Fusarium sp. DS 682]